MDTTREDAMIRSLPVHASRRDVLQGLAGAGVVAFLGSPPGASDVAAKKKPRRRKHKHRSPSPRLTAQASRGWCRSDPVIMIGDVLVDIFLSAPLDAPLKVTGPNEIVVMIPDTLPGWVVAETPGFGRGETVSIVPSPNLRVTPDLIQVTIKAFVPANDDQMPVDVEFAPRVVGLLAPESAHGLANDWIVLKKSTV